MPKLSVSILLNDINRQITISKMSSQGISQRQLTPRECPVLQDIDGDIAAVLAHDGLLPTEELVTALTDFIPAGDVKSCRVQLFEVARGLYSEVVSDGGQQQSVPLRLKSRRGAKAQSACARDLVQLFKYICGILSHFPLDTLAAPCHPLLSQTVAEIRPRDPSSTQPSAVDSHKSNSDNTEDITEPLSELVGRCSDHDRAIVDMQCTLTNALNELDKLKHKNTQCINGVLSPNATVCSDVSSIILSPDNEYPCPGQPQRDPSPCHQSEQTDSAVEDSSSHSSVILTLGNTCTSPINRGNRRSSATEFPVSTAPSAILLTPECSLAGVSEENSSLTALLQSTPHNSPLSRNVTHSNVADKSIACDLLGVKIQSAIDEILTEMRVMKESCAELDARVRIIEARYHNPDDGSHQSLRGDLQGLGQNIERIHHSVKGLSEQLRNSQTNFPSTVPNSGLEPVTTETITVPCSNRFAALADTVTEVADAVLSQHSDQHDDAGSSPAPVPARHTRPSADRRKRHKRRTKVSVVGSSLVRGLGNLLNDSETDVCCNTYPGGTIERIAPRLPTVTREDDEVIVLSAGSNNIPHYDVATIIRRAGEMVDDLQHLRPHAQIVIPAIPRRYDDPHHSDIYRDKIDRVNVFLKHKCKKSSKLHFMKHNFCFADYKADGLHFNQHGIEKYAQNVKSIIGDVINGDK